jgi:hypothetical protein
MEHNETTLRLLGHIRSMLYLALLALGLLAYLMLQTM